MYWRMRCRNLFLLGVLSVIMQSRFSGLWRHADFMKLWTGQTTSLFGSQITFFALPLAAALTLRATPIEMGILGAVQYVPGLLIGLFAGVWVDRMRRRPILIGADIGRAVFLGTIPVLAIMGVLRIEYLYIIAFLTGIFTVFFDVAYLSFLPGLVEREHLVEGNSKLQISQSVAQIAGPSIAGGLVQFVTAPIAIAFDAISFLISALFLRLIHTREPELVPREQRRNIWREIGEGIGVVLRNPILRAIAASTGTLNLFVTMLLAIYLLYLARELAIEPVLLGLIFAAFGPGTLLGALMTSHITKHFGLGPSIAGSIVLAGVADLFIPLTSILPLMIAVPVLIAVQFLIGFTGPVYSVTTVSVRQAITPDRLLGRVGATMRVLTSSMLPVGALLGGVLGERFGLRTTLLIAALGVIFTSLWVFFSPIWPLREPPAPPVETPLTRT